MPCTGGRPFPHLQGYTKQDTQLILSQTNGLLSLALILMTSLMKMSKILISLSTVQSLLEACVDIYARKGAMDEKTLSSFYEKL